jgi:hypothetical protein
MRAQPDRKPNTATGTLLSQDYTCLAIAKAVHPVSQLGPVRDVFLQKRIRVLHAKLVDHRRTREIKRQNPAACITRFNVKVRSNHRFDYIRKHILAGLIKIL